MQTVKTLFARSTGHYVGFLMLRPFYEMSSTFSQSFLFEIDTAKLQSNLCTRNTLTRLNTL